jgi:SAM-dependent methyltransferase
MSEDATIQALIRIHEGLDHLGPGGEPWTRRALELCRPDWGATPDRPRVLDLGCGAGASSLVLSEVTGGRVIAVDRVEAFLGRLRERVGTRDIVVVCGDMTAPTVELSQSLGKGMDSSSVSTQDARWDERVGVAWAGVDLLWCEGAVYFLGVEAALRAWWPLVRPGGYFGFTELCWTTETPPAEALAYWQSEYPAMGVPEQHRATAERAGWRVMGEFVLGAEAWANYHGPLERRLNELLAAHPEDAVLQAVGAATRNEIDLVRRFPDAFGYVFFVLQRPLD